jgi:hypothetical protein
VPYKFAHFKHNFHPYQTSQEGTTRLSGIVSSKDWMTVVAEMDLGSCDMFDKGVDGV